jgi:hypothetical protein
MPRSARSMPHITLPCLLLLLCSSTLVSCRNQPFSDELNRIEQHVQLPRGAEPIDKYSRYYVRSGDVISALYVIHPTLYLERVSRFCMRSRGQAFPCGPRAGQSGLVGSGERRWLGNVDELPIPEGGGCGAITFSYNTKLHQFSNVQCNGSH